MTAYSSENIFADLNILHDPSNPRFTAETVKMAVSLGFDTVAINVEMLDLNEDVLAIDEETASGSKKKQKGKRQKMKSIPEPFKLNPDHIDQSILLQNGKRLRQYTRITLGLDDPSMVHNVLKHPTILKYDILAICPKSEQIFNTVISKTDVDVVCVDVTSSSKSSGWISKKNLVQMAVEKGITFEITYAQALANSSMRRDVLVNGRDLFRATKGKGLMMNSRAERPIEIRSPYDVANLSVLFGMTTEQGRRLISSAPKQLILRAESKRTVKGVINVQKCSEVEPTALASLLKIPEFRVEIERIAPTVEIVESVDEKIKIEDEGPAKKRKKT